jgi:hypothetical protein
MLNRGVARYVVFHTAARTELLAMHAETTASTMRYRMLSFLVSSREIAVPQPCNPRSISTTCDESFWSHWQCFTLLPGSLLSLR